VGPKDWLDNIRQRGLGRQVCQKYHTDRSGGVAKGKVKSNRTKWTIRDYSLSQPLHFNSHLPQEKERKKWVLCGGGGHNRGIKSRWTRGGGIRARWNFGAGSSELKAGTRSPKEGSRGKKIRHKNRRGCCKGEKKKRVWKPSGLSSSNVEVRLGGHENNIT